MLIGMLLVYQGFTAMGMAYEADAAAWRLYQLLAGSAHALAGGCTIGIAFALRSDGSESPAARLWCPAPVRWALVAGMLASVVTFVEALGRSGEDGFGLAPGAAALASAGFLVFLFSVYGLTTRRSLAA